MLAGNMVRTTNGFFKNHVFNWTAVPIVTLETNGSDCFYESMSLNNGRFNSIEKNLPRGVNLVYNDEYSLYLAHFTEFSSRASGSLGASEPSAGVVKMALERPGGIKTVSVPDELSIEALTLFASK
jgi:L-serine/L-threonine ammonia-lyase